MEAKTIEQFAQIVDERFGFRPPVAELLANDMAAELLTDVTSARLLATERVGWARCEHLRLDQKGMAIDLWVGAKDVYYINGWAVYVLAAVPGSTPSVPPQPY